MSQGHTSVAVTPHLLDRRIKYAESHDPIEKQYFYCHC